MCAYSLRRQMGKCHLKKVAMLPDLRILPQSVARRRMPASASKGWTVHARAARFEINLKLLYQPYEDTIPIPYLFASIKAGSCSFLGCHN